MKGSKRGCCILLDSTDHMKMNMLMDKVTASGGVPSQMNTTPLPVGKYHETSDHNEEDSLKIFASASFVALRPRLRPRLDDIWTMNGI